MFPFRNITALKGYFSSICLYNRIRQNKVTYVYLKQYWTFILNFNVVNVDRYANQDVLIIYCIELKLLVL